MTDQQLKTAYPPIKFQMWDEAHKRMFVWENVDHRILIAAVVAKDIENVRLLPFTGINDSLGNDIYLDDIARVTIQNEFGSLEVLLVQISYFPMFAAYAFNFRGRVLFADKIKKIEKMGNVNANPELMNVGKKVKFDD